jgi:hypothetical protein
VETALAAGAGFLLAVLWMDLMFDVQVLRFRGGTRELPEEVLASIAAYYRRVTTDARPLGHLVGTVMALVLAGVGIQIAGAGSRGVGLGSLALCGPPIALAFARVLPNAVRLGARGDPPARQSQLARAICRDHLLCLAGIAGFGALQLWAAR